MGWDNNLQSANHASASKEGAGNGVRADVVVTIFEVHAENFQVIDVVYVFANFFWCDIGTAIADDKVACSAEAETVDG